MQEAVQKIVDDLKSHGVSLASGIFHKETLRLLQSSILKRSLKKAGVSRSAQVENTIRGDSISWLDPKNLSQEQKEVWDFLSLLQSELNKKLFLGIKEFECHLTMYPKGSFYQRHIDQFKNSDLKKRMVSFILYLNENWKLEDGGELVLYRPEPLRVLPQCGQMILFLSSEFEHEVLPTNRERFSLTGWMYQY